MSIDEIKLKYYRAMRTFWLGMERQSDKLADIAYRNNNIGIYKKFNDLFWVSSRKYHKYYDKVHQSHEKLINSLLKAEE